MRFAGVCRGLLKTTIWVLDKTFKSIYDRVQRLGIELNFEVGDF